MYALVVGGGKVGYYLTRTLVAENYEVALVEKDRRRWELLSEEFGEIVFLGDGCEARTMDEVGMGRADVVVAVTGHDEDNLVICQLAKRKFSVPRTVARVNNPKNEDILRRLGIDDTLCGTRIIYSLIEQEVETGEVVPLTAVKEGRIEIVEADISAESPAVNRMVKDIHLPGDSILAAVIRDDQIMVPGPTTVLAEKDVLIALTRPEDEKALRKTLSSAGAGEGETRAR